MADYTANMKLPARVSICEVVTRDGLQNEKEVMATERKNLLIQAVVAAGVKIVEAGSFVNPKAVPQMADTEQVFANIASNSTQKDVEYRALILNKRGIERAYECGVKKAKLTLSASQSHQKANANQSHDEIFANFAAIAEFAKLNGVTLSGAISTAFGCPFEGAVPVEAIIDITKRYDEIGVGELSLSDTTGMADPALVYRNVSIMKERFPGIVWNLHFHNTRGMGLANVLAGMQAGVSRFDASLGGLGGCPFAPGASGNIATEDLVHMLDLMGIETGIDLGKLLEAAKMLQGFVGRELASAVLKAGRNSDLHERVLKLD
ncbi:MAG: hydroxymethylglutaryl-CoA lyase [Spirochaetes bacterium]|nr:hydroxymethylglutaryl-CoA lyase [Spirochaetota bacterium]